MTNKDKTGTARQQARRKREKEWLKDHGFKSWESLHTQLMNGAVILDFHTPQIPKSFEEAGYYDDSGTIITKGESTLTIRGEKPLKFKAVSFKKGKQS